MAAFASRLGRASDNPPARLSGAIGFGQDGTWLLLLGRDRKRTLLKTEK